MSDEIKGVAVLNDLLPDQVLYCVCVPAAALPYCDGKPFVMRLPIRPQGAARTQEPQWQYHAEGNILHCSPSVYCKGSHPEGTEPNVKMVEHDIFHNGGSWQIPFVRWSELAPTRGENDGGAWSTCYDVNPELVG